MLQHRNSNLPQFILGLALGLAALTGVATAQTPGFYLTGEAGGAPTSFVRAVSGDGRVAAGWSQDRGAPYFDRPGFLWTSSGGREDFGALPGMPRNTKPQALSSDGRVVVGESAGDTTGVRGFRYSAATGIELLSPLPGYEASAARSVSGDGTIAAGVTSGAGLLRQAVRWGPDGSVQNLPLLPTGGYFAAEANAVSRDGRVIAGYCQSLAADDACVWTAAGVQALPRLPGAAGAYISSANGANADGSVIVGNASRTGVYNGQVLWRDGQVIQLGTPGAGYGAGAAYATNDIGNIVVGSTNASGPLFERATIWLDGSGMQLLSDYALAQGVQIPAGYTLGSCRSVSGDGLVFGGETFNPQGLPVGFVLVVPTPGTTVLGVAVPVVLVTLRRRR